jgi:hypothetical protein
MPMTKAVLSLLLVLYLMVGVISAGEDSKVVLSKDKRLQISLPKDWELTEPPEDIENLHIQLIKAKSLTKPALFVVTSDRKQDVNRKSIQEYAEHVLKVTTDKVPFEDRATSGPKKLKINEADAVQYRLDVTLNKAKLVVLKTFVESPTRWNQLEFVTEPAEFDKMQDDVNAINDSFKEIPTEQKK